MAEQTIAGALVGKALHAYPDKWEPPELKDINPTKIQQETIAGNYANLPEAQTLANAVNQGNAAQLRAILNRGGQLDLAEKIVSSQMRGELPLDVQRSLQDTVAAQSARLGVGGSQFQTGLGGLRGVLSSLQLQQQGLANFGNLAQLTTPKLVGAEAMFFTPQQRLSFAVQDRAEHFQRDLLARHMAAQPNAADVALAEGFNNFFDTWKNVGMGALGGMGGGGGGGMMGMMGGGGGGGGKQASFNGAEGGGGSSTYGYGGGFFG